jgi:DNA polymerase-4
MDAFYASVEQRDEPRLRGRPVAVGGMQRGVVAAASYEARKFGVRSAMPMSRALRLCPELCVVPPNFTKYKEVSAQVFSIFEQVTPLVEGLSLDEAYLDVTENAWGEALGVKVARRIKEAIREKTQLTASAGVAPNKFLAKIASAWRKPDGLTVIPPERVESFLDPLPVDALWGVGPVTERHLRSAGLATLADVRRADPKQLHELVGRFAETLLALSRGIDERAVEPHRVRKSVGSETTFPQDLTDLDELRATIGTLVQQSADWLQRHGQFARTVTLKVRYADFETVTRSETAAAATCSVAELSKRAVALLEKTAAGQRPIRLLGVSLHGLSENDTEPQKKPRPPKPDSPKDSPQLRLPFRS